MNLTWTFLKVIVIITVIIFLLLLTAEKIANKYLVWDYADVLYANVFDRYKVENYNEIRDILLRYPDTPISIAGGKFSHGGHTFKENAIYLDMINMNKVICFDPEKKELTAQSGITWRQIIEFLDPYNLSVKAMQSYANFTLGGSISVNAHGRGIEYSTVGSTLLSMKVMLADGSILTIYPSDILFSGVLGGYGGIAIILEATIGLTDNYLIKKVVQKAVNVCGETIYKTINMLDKNPGQIVLYNGLIYPERRKDLFNIYYVRTDFSGKNFEGSEISEEPTSGVSDELSKGPEKLQESRDYYWLPMLSEQILRRSKILKYCRAYLEPYFESFGTNEINDIKENTVPVWRNWELTYDTNKHRSLFRFPTTTALQEYFIPINEDTIDMFIREFNRVTETYNVNLLNISLRYVRVREDSPKPILDYAPNDRLAIVIYYNLLNNPYSLANTARWTQEVLNVVLTLKGSYYLPYLPLATVEQFRRAYPNYKYYMDLKRKYDPNGRFCSQFLQDYELSHS